MTVKEYLSQGYRLEQRIKMHQDEIEGLKALATSVGSPGFNENHNATKSTAAPFEKTLLRIMEMEKEHAEMLDKLLTFKRELMLIFEEIQNKDERLVLYYRYIHNMRWTDIADKLGWDPRTIKRWHNKAMAKVVIPDNPTIIDNFLLKK